MLFDFDRFERERLAREASARGLQNREPARWRRLSVLLCGAAALAAALWWTLPLATWTRGQLVVPPLKMHVAEVMPTDASFGEAQRVVTDRTAFWRVAIRDSDEHPLAGVLVQVDVLAADGAVRAQQVTTTNGDGLALFRYVLPVDDAPHVYTIRVVNVFHTLHPGAVYDRAANAAWSSSFSVSGASSP